jgi:hypothetical protein
MWSDDPKTMAKFDEMMRGFLPLVQGFMNSMTEYLDGSPNSVMLRVSAKCVVHYNKARVDMNCTEHEAYHYMLSQLSGDPEVQNMMGQFSQMMMNRGAGLE